MDEWSGILKNEVFSLDDCKHTIGAIDKIIGKTDISDEIILGKLQVMHHNGEMETDVFEFFISMINRRKDVHGKMPEFDKSELENIQEEEEEVVVEEESGDDTDESTTGWKSSLRTSRASPSKKKSVRFL